MNRVFLIGNITGDIFFDTPNHNGQVRPFLRLILMAEKPRIVRGLRVIMWEDKAERFYPYLRKGSEIAVLGHLQTREYKQRTVTEVEAKNLILLKNIAWEEGERIRASRGDVEANVSANHVFLVGTVGDDRYFTWMDQSDTPGRYAYLRLLLSTQEYVDGLRIVARGTLAELTYPYLRAGSVVAVDGHVQTRSRETGEKVVEVTAEHLGFLNNIDWDSGNAARLRMLERQEQIAAGV